MRFSKSIRIFIILGILFFSTAFHLRGFSRYNQFIEVRNFGDVPVTISLLNPPEDDGSGVKKLITVSPKTWRRAMGVIPPGIRDFEVEYDTIHASLPGRVNGVQVNDYRAQTFLTGKRFVIGQPGGTKVIRLNLLQGKWTYYRLERGKPKLDGTYFFQEAEPGLRGRWGPGTDMSELNTHPVSGKFNYPSLTFQVNMYRMGIQAKFILQVSGGFDKWVGIKEIQYVDKGQQREMKEKVVLTVDPVRMTVKEKEVKTLPDHS